MVQVTVGAGDDDVASSLHLSYGVQYSLLLHPFIKYGASIHVLLQDAAVQHDSAGFVAVPMQVLH